MSTPEEKRKLTLARDYTDIVLYTANDIIERIDRALHHLTKDCPVVRLKRARCDMECLAEAGVDSIPYHEVEVSITKMRSVLELMRNIKHCRGEQLTIVEEALQEAEG